MQYVLAAKGRFQIRFLENETKINVDKWSVLHIQRLYVVQKNKNSQIVETIFDQKYRINLPYLL